MCFKQFCQHARWEIEKPVVQPSQYPNQIPFEEGSGSSVLKAYSVCYDRCGVRVDMNLCFMLLFFF